MTEPNMHSQKLKSVIDQAASEKPWMNAQFILTVLRRWWKIATPVAVVTAVSAGAAVYLLFKPQYQAIATIRIDDVASYIAYEDRGNSKRFVETQVQLLQHRLVLDPVIGLPEIASLSEIVDHDDPVGKLRKNLGIKSVGKSELYEVSYAAPNPKEAALIVNEILKSYFKLRSQTEAERTRSVIVLLEDQRGERESKVQRLRDKVRTLTLDATGQDPFAANQDTVNPPVHPLMGLQTRLITTDFELAMLKAHIDMAESRNDVQQDEDSEWLVGRTIEQHPQVQQLKSLISQKQAKLHEISSLSAMGKKDPFYEKLTSEITRDKETLDSFRSELQEQAKSDIHRAVVFDREEDLNRQKSQYNDYLLLKEILEERYTKELGNVENYTGETLELEIARADLERAQQVLDLISARTDKLRIEQNRPSRVQLLAEAVPPTTPIEKLPYKPLLLACMSSFCAPFGIALLWELRTRKISGRHNLEQHSSLTVIGEIASLPINSSLFGGSMSNRLSRDLRLFEESIDSLRTSIILSESLRNMKVLAISSAASREGKTSVAAQLAVSIAKATGERTLLIDGDMRSPDLHDVFETALEPGFADALDHKVSLEECVVPTSNKRLHLLPAGKLRISPHKLVGNGALSSLIKEASDSYRYIIIDTPPILAASESLVLARASDASLLCVMRDVSRVDQVRSAYDRLLGAGAKPIGAVVNGIPTHNYAYSYGGYDYGRD